MGWIAISCKRNSRDLDGFVCCDALQGSEYWRDVMRGCGEGPIDMCAACATAVNFVAEEPLWDNCRALGLTARVTWPEPF